MLVLLNWLSVKELLPAVAQLLFPQIEIESLVLNVLEFIYLLLFF